MYPELFRIGDFPINAYGVWLAIGLMTALFVAALLAKKDGLPKERVYDLGLWTILGGLIGSKALMVLTEVSKEYNVPDNMQSCHTAIVDGYVIEGHVPADDVKKLLDMRPTDIAGLAAPGMPAKSPEMQPGGEKPSGYDVLSFDKQGNSKVFASYKQ